MNIQRFLESINNPRYLDNLHEHKWMKTNVTSSKEAIFCDCKPFPFEARPVSAVLLLQPSIHAR